MISDPSDPIQWLQSQSLRAEVVGWKAAVLNDFKTAGLAVPPGFIISPCYFQTFIQELSLHLMVSSHSARQLWQIAEGLQQQVDTLTFPPQWERSLRRAYADLRDNFPNTLYILRPSIGVIQTRQSLSERSPQGFTSLQLPLQTTGLLESVLHPMGNADEESLWLQFCESLRSLYRQCFQARSLLYWQHHHQPLAHLPLGVLVQPLLPALASGTIDISPQEIQISATWGMGLSLSRGETIPDRYVFKGSDPTESPTSQRGQHTWVYWHPETPVSGNCPVEGCFLQGCFVEGSLLKDCPVDVSSPSLRAALTLQKVTPEAQQRPVLTPAQLETLRQQALALLPLLCDRCSLEWILSPSPSNPADLTLVWTQGTCYPLETLGSEENKAHALSRLAPFSDQTLTEANPEESVVLKTIQGQGVSKGVQVGRVYSLEALEKLENLNHHPSGDFLPLIVVANQLTPEVFPWLHRVKGLVLAQGGTTSHGAILARELQIPAVVGVERTHLGYILSQDWIRVDGNQGQVQVLSGFTPIASRKILQSHLQGRQSQSQNQFENQIRFHRTQTLPEPSLPPTQTRILATLNQVASLASIPSAHIDGVGLLRSEWFCLDLWEGQHPHRWIAQGRQAELHHRFRQRLQQCIHGIHPRPLFYRSVDCRAPELQSLVGQDVFPWTVGGTFAHCLDPSVLTLEFEVLHEIDRSGSPVHLILPMVRTVEEFIRCRDRYQQFLQAHTVSPSHSTPFFPQPLPLWIMVEVPSLLLQLPALAKAGVQGLVIGPGDLSHYLLGLDRCLDPEGLIDSVYHPIIHQTLLQLLQEAKNLQLPTILCCHTETLPQVHLDAYVQAGLWGITAELPHIQVLRQGILRSEGILQNEWIGGRSIV